MVFHDFQNSAGIVRSILALAFFFLSLVSGCGGLVKEESKNYRSAKSNVLSGEEQMSCPGRGDSNRLEV